MRRKTKVVKIGNVLIGGDNPIAIQSMTNTKTKDITSTASQINQMEKLGCNIARCAVLDLDDAYAIKKIKKLINIPLVADIHYDYKLALASIDAGCDKLRINPGNIGKIENVQKIVQKCKEHHIPIRIGINGGSLDKKIVDIYGHTPKAMVESLRQHIRILEELDFYDIVLSLKSSDLNMCLEAYKIASAEFNYPMHIGITEAGTAFSGTIKSSIGISRLLDLGIGDTLRVSLATDPLEEIKVAKEILSCLGLHAKPQLICCPTCGRTQYNMFKIVSAIELFLDTVTAPITVAIMGCAVNGPGEASHADIGIAGGINEALLFKKGKIIRKIPENNIIEEFKKEIINLINEK